MSILEKRCALLSVAILAQTIVCLPPFAMAATGDIKIADKVVFVNKAGFGKESRTQHTAEIQKNLNNALIAASDLTPSAVHVVKAKGNWDITLGGYKVVTVDATNAKLAKTTTPVLAQRWAAALRKELGNSDEVSAYVAQISGGTDTTASASGNEPGVAPDRSAEVAVNAQAQTNVAVAPPVVQQDVSQGQPSSTFATQPLRARVIYAPAGLTIPITLATAVSTEVAKAGDVIQATTTQDINLGNGVIPAGSTVMGQVTDAEPGRRLDRAAVLGIKFTTLRTPDGVETPLTAHLTGGLGKYMEVGAEGSDVFKSEGTKSKVESAAMRGLVGAGSGAALGTAVGAIAGGGHGAGKGAWSGAAIGGGLGVVDSLLVRKTKDVVLPSGTQMQLQLDAPLSITCAPGS